MIIYGSKASNLKNGEIRNVTCPNCETETSMKYSNYRKYGHVYWIPLFPMSKTTLTECNHCKRTFEFFELPQPIQNKILKQNEMHPVKTPLWMFSGLFIVAGLVSFGVYNSSETDKNEAAYIKNPKVGDVYYFKCDTVPTYYSAVRIDRVTKDSLSGTMNDYQTNLTSGMDEMDVPKNYTTEKFGASRKDLEHLHEVDTIYTIIRK